MNGSQPQGDEEADLPSGLHYAIGRTVRFSVHQLPIPQGSTRAFIVNNKPVITTTSRKLGAWRNLVATVAQQHVTSAFHGPVAVTLRFFLPRPKSAPKRKYVYPDKRPDLDKLVRAVLDAITPIIIADDSQVVALEATKDYGEAGVDIRVEEIKA